MWFNEKFRRKFKAALDNAEIAQTSLHIKLNGTQMTCNLFRFFLFLQREKGNNWISRNILGMHLKVLYNWKMLLDAKCKSLIENHYAKVYFDFYVRTNFNIFPHPRYWNKCFEGEEITARLETCVSGSQ